MTVKSILQQRFHIDPERKEKDAVTFSRMGTLFYGQGVTLKPFTANADDLLPNKINIVEKQRDVSVMGFGTSVQEAYRDAYEKMQTRRKKRGWNIVELANGITLVNGMNFQYHLAGTLIKIR